MNEPTVWDFIKALLTFRRSGIPTIPPLPEETFPQEPGGEGEPGTDLLEGYREGTVIAAAAGEMEEGETAAASLQTEYASAAQPVRPRANAASLPWFTGGALLLALLAQRSFEPSATRGWQTGLVLYLLAFVLAGLALLRKEWDIAGLPEAETQGAFPGIRWPWLVVSLPLILAAFISFGDRNGQGGFFTLANTLLWLAAIFAMLKAFLPGSGANWLQKLGSIQSWKLTITPFALLFIAVVLVVTFYRTHLLAAVPPEMNSDHAEKLLDVGDVLSGLYKTYFPRNTGREALQFYMIALTARLFGTGISFISMKIGTVLAGLLTLPFIYLLGKELGNRRVGLIAMLLAGIAYWPNVLSRIALRFSLYPLFVAPALYFLIRGLRRSSIKDFVLAGLFLGVGLHGYTPIRILPFVIVAAVVIFLLHRQTKISRQTAVYGLLVITLVSIVVALPLLRYALDYPDNFAFRAFSRVGALEQGYPEPPWKVFLSNTWRAMIMPAWDDGSIWVVSLPGRPALDIVSAAFFYLGFILLIVRYALKRRWQDLFLVLSVPMLMLPSILSLAFPGENPAPNRAGGAMVVIFVIAALAFDGVLTSIRTRFSPLTGKFAAVTLIVVLVGWSLAQNYDLVFHQYRQQYEAGAWNSSEMGQVIGDFARSFGSPDNAWVVAHAHWVDTRLVGINAGYWQKDYAIFPEDLSKTAEVEGAKMFIVFIEDTAVLDSLHTLYPGGWQTEYQSKYANKNFWVYFAPPGAGAPLP